jgi:IS4 transposase
MDSTTISLFSNILKGAGRNPKRGKKKGGIKAHTVIRAEENVPLLVRYTSAATHDHCLLKYLDLPEGSFVALDRAYIDYGQFERFTEKGISYVTKMKKNLSFTCKEDLYNPQMAHESVIRDDIICFSKGEINHISRRVEYWDMEKSKTVVLLTNNFELSHEDIIEIYRRRWQIELLFKQLKQNFPLKYFYGDSVNAIEIQIWVTFIANLLLTLVKNKVKRKWSFSNMVTMIRQMLMYYVDMYRFLENPEKEWLAILKSREESPPEHTLFD